MKKYDYLDISSFVEQLMEKKESAEIEFKSAAGGFPKAFAITEGVVSNERLRYTLNLYKYDITKMLKDLCGDGYLISDGVGRGTTYHLNVREQLTNPSDNLNSSDCYLNSNLNSSDSNLNSSAGDNPKIYQETKKIKRRCSQQELFN